MLGKISDKPVPSDTTLYVPHSPSVEMSTTTQPNVNAHTAQNEIADSDTNGQIPMDTLPGHSNGHALPFFQGLKAVIFSSWLNILLIFIPISWAFHFARLNDTLIFVFSFLAIVPLAQLLAFSTEQLSLRTNQTIAGLLNATFGNAVELIIAIIALTKCELQIVQASLIGSILSNLLLVLGMCFFVGGTRFSYQGLGSTASQINSTLLVIAVIAILLPAAFDLVVATGQNGDSGRKITESDSDYQFDILHLSHGVAIILFLIYISYIIFQLYTHANLYADNTPTNNNPDVIVSRRYDTEEARSEDAEEEKEPQISLGLALVLLVVVTVLVALTSDFLVDSVDGLTSGGHISKEFVGIILIAIVGNASEHVTAVMVSYKDKLTLSIGVAVGSSIQIALFVIPFVVTLGWILGKPLTMLFDPLESIVLFFAVLTVNQVVADGKSNWLEGAVLFLLYIIIAVIFYYYPGSDPVIRYNQLTCNPKTR